jgi:hypothetical protein
MKLLFLILALCAPGLTQSYLRVTYDKFDDETSVDIWNMPLGRGVLNAKRKDGGLSLSIHEVFKGRSLAVAVLPETRAYVTLLAENDLGLGSMTAPPLTFLIDGERFKVKTEWARSSSKKEIRLLTTYALLIKLAGAKQIEGKLGFIEFHLTQNHQHYLRAFLKALSVDVSKSHHYTSSPLWIFRNGPLPRTLSTATSSTMYLKPSVA